MRNRDWTLLVIAAARGSAMTPVQLQKSLFLLSRNLRPEQLNLPALYDFQPYDYGPFDSAVYSDAEALGADQLITISNDGRYRTYSIAARGAEESEVLRKQIDANAAKYVDDVVSWVLPKSFGDLVRAIYKTYPEMREHSVFKF
jgi:hypothetical protein